MNIPKIPDGRVVKVVNGGKYALRDLVDWLKKSEFNGYITQRLGKSESKMYLRKGEPAYVFNTSFNDGGTSFVQMLEDSTLPDTTIEVHALTKEQVQDADRILANSEESKVDPLYLNYDIDLVRLKISELEKVALRQQKSAVPESKMPTPSCEIKDETVIEERKGEKDVSKEKGENIGKKVNYSSKNGKKVRVRVVKNTVKNDERKEDKEDDKEVEAEIKIIENAKNEKEKGREENTSDMNFDKKPIPSEKTYGDFTNNEVKLSELQDGSEVCAVECTSENKVENMNEKNEDIDESRIAELARLLGVDRETAKEVISNVDDTILNDMLNVGAFEETIEKHVAELKEKEERICSKEKFLNEKIKEIEEREKNLMNKENELMLKEKEIEIKKREIDEKLSGKEKCNIEFKEEEVKEIQEEINRCFAELDEREKVLKESERVLELECAQVEGKIRALSELEKKLSDEKRMLEDRAKELDRREEILKSRIEDFNSDLEKVVTEHKEKEKQLDEKWLRFLKEESKLKQSIAKVEEQTNYLKNEEKRLNEEKIAFEKERKKGLEEIAKIRKEVEHEKKIIEDGKKILDKKEKELREIEREHENKIKEIERKEKELSRIEFSLSSKRAEIDELAFKLREEEDKLAKAWADFRAERANFESMFSKKKAELENIEKEIRARELAIEKRENECRAWESRCKAWETECKTWDEEINKRKRRFEEEIRTFEDRKGLVDERERMIERLFSQNGVDADCLLKLDTAYAKNANEKVIEKGKSAEIEELRKLISMMFESKKEKRSEPKHTKQVIYVPKVSRMLIRSEDEIKKLELTYPRELIDFYLRDEGSVLLIKGTQGCGRTIFSLQFVEDWSKPEYCYYFSTRRNEDVRKRYSWVEDAEMRANALFTQEDAVESIIEESEALREKGERGVFLFNRYEKFCEKNKLEPSSFLELLRIEVAQKNNVAVICILDGPDTKPYDELADGILLFKQHRRDNADEFLGQLELKELDGVDIKMNKYMYNLQGGRFAILKGVGYQ